MFGCVNINLIFHSPESIIGRYRDGRGIYPLLGIARLPAITYDSHINFLSHFLVSREHTRCRTLACKISIAKFKPRDLCNALHHDPRSGETPALIERAIIPPDWTLLDPKIHFSLRNAKKRFFLLDDDTLHELSNFVVPSFAKSHHLVNCSIRLIKISFDIVHKLRKLLSFLSSEKSRRSDSEKHLKLTESEASKRKRLIA